MRIMDKALAKKFLDDRDNVDLTEVTGITDEAAEILGALKEDLILVDGLKSLSAAAAGHLSSAGGLSLKGLEELDEDVAAQLAKHGLTLALSGVKTASDAVMMALSKYEGRNLDLDGLSDVSDSGIKALANTKANLDLSSLKVISEDALELLVRGRRDFLSLGLQSLSEKQARILEFFHGKNLVIDSVGEISDVVAESLARISSDSLSLGGLHDFSEFAAERLGSMATRRLVLPGRLEISRAALNKLFGANFRNGNSALLFTGEILLPEYAPEYPGQEDAYESVYTDSVINRRRMKRWLAEDKRYRNPSISGSILTLPAAELLADSRSSTDICIDLQRLPDNVAEALERHTGSISIKIDRLTPFVARCLAQRKYRKNSYWSLSLNLNSLEAAEAAELARARCNLSLRFPEKLQQFRKGLGCALSDEAARLLADYEGESLVLMISELSDAAVEALATYKGDLNLNELKKLSDAAAESLSKHQGDLMIGSWLETQESCSDAAREALSRKSGTINCEEPEQWAIEQMMKQELIELSDAAAEMISRYEGEQIELNSLTTLSDTAAKALAKVTGSLSLNGLTGLSDAAAEALSKHMADLSLDGLNGISDTAAISLTNYKGEICGMAPAEWVASLDEE